MEGYHELQIYFSDKARVVRMQRQAEPKPVEGGTGSPEEQATFKMASRLVSLLDTEYDKEQVYAIATWMKYLATQD